MRASSAIGRARVYVTVAWFYGTKGRIEGRIGSHRSTHQLVISLFYQPSEFFIRLHKPLKSLYTVTHRRIIYATCNFTELFQLQPTSLSPQIQRQVASPVFMPIDKALPFFRLLTLLAPGLPLASGDDSSSYSVLPAPSHSPLTRSEDLQ